MVFFAIMGAFFDYLFTTTALLMLIKKVIQYLPESIIMGMIAGALSSYATRIITAVQKDYIGAGLTLLAFFVAGLFSKKFPPHAVALIVGIIVSIFIMKSKVLTGEMEFYTPVFFKPPQPTRRDLACPTLSF